MLALISSAHSLRPVVSSWQLTELMMLLLLCATQSEAIWTYSVSWPDGNVTLYSYQWAPHGDCLYDKSRDVLTCMRNHGYQSVVNAWTYDPELIMYVSVRCQKQTASKGRRTSKCLCKNNTHALTKTTSGDLVHSTESYYSCWLKELSPVMFENLEQLEVLDLSSNFLEQVSRDCFANLRELRVLSLHSNPLRELPEDMVCPLTSLEVLNLRRLPLTSFPGHIFRCDGNATTMSLRWLDVSDSHISVVPSGSFWYLDKLAFLNISNNLVQSLPPHAFLGAFSLQAVDLSKNLISKLPEAFCEGTPELKLMIVRDNMFDSLELKEFEECESLSRLDFSRNTIAALLGPPAYLPSLRELILAHNQLQTLSGRILNHNCTLRMLDLSHNNLRSISDDVFDTLLSLERLDLRNNYLTELNCDLSRIFQQLTSLIVLDLRSNLLTSVSSGDFDGLTSLLALDLSDNRIATLTFDTNPQLIHLRHLNLSKNLLTSFSPQVFASLTDLQVLDLSDNLLHDLYSLRVNIKLTTLDLSRNSLRSVPVLPDAWNLRDLRLSWNSISHLENWSLRGLSSLQELDLSHNSLTNIHPETFLSVPHMRSLQLAHNHLVLNGTDAGQIFSRMRMLQKLNLSHNVLHDVQVLFHPESLSALLDLDVSFNSIGRIPGRLNRWNRTMHVQHVHLEGCVVHEIDDDAFVNMIYLRSINLQNNLLTHVPLFRAHAGIKYFLNGNPIVCSCQMSWLKQSVVHVLNEVVSTRDYDVSTCTVMPRGSQQAVQSLTHQDFLCQTDLACPLNCTCYSQLQAGEPTVVFCNQSLTAVPSDLPITARVISLEGCNLGHVYSITDHSSPTLAVEELYLNGSKISLLGEWAFLDLPLLSVLDLSNNQLTTLNPNVFFSLENLTSLSLRNNQIVTLPSGLFSHSKMLRRLDVSHNYLDILDAKTIQEWSYLPELSEVFLSHNPFRCTCGNVFFYRWLKENATHALDRASVMCADFPTQPIYTSDQQRFNCLVDVGDELSPGVIAGIVVGSLVVGILAALVYHFHSIIGAVMYSRLGMHWVKPHSDHVMGALYDVSILYDHADRKCNWWVERVLVPRLTSPKWRLRVHVPLAGEAVAAEDRTMDSAVYSVRQSRACLVLVSKHFGAHQHTVTSLQQVVLQAQQRPNSLVLVTWGELTKQTLECGIRDFIGGRQHVPITSSLFWDRLLYRLPASSEAANRRHSLIAGCRFRSLSDVTSDPVDTLPQKEHRLQNLPDVTEHI